ncbi:MAG: hypothetical protein JNM90_24725, partial [Burkholderiales bacterium]|nr:hypothetical protein [Burkholderiales bacterium]
MVATFKPGWDFRGVHRASPLNFSAPRSWRLAIVGNMILPAFAQQIGVAVPLILALVTSLPANAHQPPYRGPAIEQIEMSHTNPDVMYVRAWMGLFASRNGGASWSVLRANGALLDTHTFAMAPSIDRFLYVIGRRWDKIQKRYSHGLFLSRDHGESWISVPAPVLTTASIAEAIAVSYTDPAVFVLVTRVGNEDRREIRRAPRSASLLATADGGRTWRTLVRNEAVESVRFLPTSRSRLVARIDRKLFAFDAETGTRDAMPGPDDVHRQELFIDGVQARSAGVLPGLASEAFGLDDARVRGLAPDRRCAVLGASGRTGDLFVNCIRLRSVWEMLTTPTADQRISRDGGETWHTWKACAPGGNQERNIAEPCTETDLPNTWYPTTFQASPSNPDLLLMGWTGGGLLKSIDRGTTWRWINNGLTHPNEESPEFAFESPLMQAILSRDASRVDKLLRAGADPNLCTLSRRPPLIRAIDVNSPEIFRSLLKAGAQL